MPDAVDFDLTVLGGGMAGMSAAAEAAQHGARVLICEIADQLGGTAALSTGNVWTVPTAQAFLESDPDGNVELWQVVRDTLEDSFAWLESIGVPVRERHKASSSSTYDPPPIGRNVDIETFLSRSRRLVEAAGGLVLNGTTISRLATTDAGVVGAEISTIATGDRHVPRARGVVLASGGFQGSQERRAQYLGVDVSGSVAIRSNPYSKGCGLQLAMAAGAQLSPRMDTFYGVVLPAVSGEITEADYRGLVLHGAVYGVVFGRDGRRLVDESSGAVPLANATARAGRALFVAGQAMISAADDQLGIDMRQMLLASAHRGARVATQASRVALAADVDSWGYDAGLLARGLEQYNETIGSGGLLDPARRRHRHALDADLIAVELQAAMTSTLGGVRTDHHGQVLRADGSPLHGLFAAGVDQGGYNVSGYAGGLSRALTFGRRAAAKALRTT